MGACKKISEHELKDCSFFIVNIWDIGVFYWHKLQKELWKLYKWNKFGVTT